MFRNFTSGSVVKNLPANTGEIREVGWIPGWEDPLEEGTATHSCILAWRIPINRGAWWVMHGPWSLKESDTTETT